MREKKAANEQFEKVIEQLKSHQDTPEAEMQLLAEAVKDDEEISSALKEITSFVN